jgi:hypothetical protein
MRTNLSLRLCGPLLAALLIVAPLALPAQAEDKPAAPAAPAAAAPDPKAVPPKMFASKEAALEALRAALAANDDAAIVALVGGAHADLVQSGKDPSVAKERARLAALIQEKSAWEEIPDGAVAVLGFKAWPMPVPLGVKDGQWFWDGEAGRDEVLARRIGAHELAVIDALRQVVEAQEAYKAADRDGDGVLEYAQRFVSTKGTRDGLWWPDAEDGSTEDRAPLGALLEEYVEYATPGERPGVWQGYRFRLLKGQGPCTPGGRMGYMQGENLVGGWAVIAYPDEYRNTGVKSFIISHRGRLFERDLGPDGEKVAKALTEFNPDSTWTRLGSP